MSEMRRAMDVLREQGKAHETGGGTVNIDSDVNLVVRCTACQMTMPVMSAFVDKVGETYCGSCAEASE